jgi:hypothetical protein
MFVRALTAQQVRMTKHSEHILMIEEMIPTNPSNAQDKSIIYPWVDPHKLKKVDGVWYKEGQRVVSKGRK